MTHEKPLGLLLASVFIACGSAPPTPARSIATAPEASSQPGVTAPANPSRADPPLLNDIRRLKKPLEECTVEPNGLFCPAYSELTDLDWTDRVLVEDELFSWLYSPHDALRYAAANLLWMEKEPKFDTIRSTRVLELLEAEKDPHMLGELVGLVDRLDFDRHPELAQRAAELVEHQTDPERERKLLGILTVIPNGAQVMVRMLERPGENRLTILSLSDNLPAEGACLVSAHGMELQVDYLMRMAVYSVATGVDCPALWDKAIDRIASTKLPPPGSHEQERMPNAIGHLCNREVSVAQRARLLKVAKRFSKARTRPSLRKDALESVIACDPKSGREFVSKFTKDRDPELAEAARDMTDH